MSFNWDHQNIQATLNSISPNDSLDSIGICDHGLKSVTWISRFVQWLGSCFSTQDTRTSQVLPRIRSLCNVLNAEEGNSTWMNQKPEVVKHLINRVLARQIIHDPIINAAKAKIDTILAQRNAHRAANNPANPAAPFLEVIQSAPPESKEYSKADLKRFALMCNSAGFGSRYNVTKNTPEKDFSDVRIYDLDDLSTDEVKRINQFLNDLKKDLSKECLALEENNKFRIITQSATGTTLINLYGERALDKNVIRMYGLTLNPSTICCLVGGFILSELNDKFKAISQTSPEAWTYTNGSITTNDDSRTPSGVILLSEIEVLDIQHPEGFPNASKWPKGVFALPVATIDGIRYVRNMPSIRIHHYITNPN